MKKKALQSGVALYIAVLISSLTLAVGLSLANIFLKEVQLSIATRESQLAFYAADSGLECARFWDTTLGGSKFASTTDPLNTIVCSGFTVQTKGDPNGQSTGVYQYDSQIGCLTPEDIFTGDSAAPPSECNSATGDEGDPMYSRFTLPFVNYRDGAAGTYPNVPCAILTIKKEALANSINYYTNSFGKSKALDGYSIQTTIEARGYNTCNPNDKKRIERAIRVQ